MIHLKAFLTLLATSNNSNNNNQETTIVYQVCLSPGCLADGAQQTLSKLQALAPPHIRIESGTCQSFCGNGPVVLQPSNGKNVVRHRKVQGSKVLELLQEGVDPLLVQGYDLVLEADRAFDKRDYETAISLYEKALSISFRSAQELQMARSRMLNDARSSMDWLVQARRKEAVAKLELGDMEGAIFAAQASCNMSNNKCAKSFGVLAEIYKRKGDKGAELETLKTLFALPVVDDKLDFRAQNERRELGFRMASLEKQVSSKS